MKIIFNYSPQPLKEYFVSLFSLSEEHLKTMEAGYASTINTSADVTVLSFKDVDDHIDGNGMAILWLTKGSGNFYYDNEVIKLKTGDVFLFDDNKEHGFESNELCLGVNITFDQMPDELLIKQKLKLFVESNKQIKTKLKY